ncbi:chemotaxis protein CheW [Janthinobacterium sp. JC611]|uniref:chemotaxis protein CheW n=1 Tax=Janthinobacterium sp. JC611 TaxID=2816201 RepID=UPI001BFD3336|nr:chemotaxis protein CheW [Janthinobacterium sp. JC611]
METTTTHAAAHAAISGQPAQAGARELLVFGLGKEEYALDIGLAQEIRGYGAVTRVANAPAFLKGFIHLRGSIVPLLDLRIALGQAEPSDDASTVVIILIFAQGATGTLDERMLIVLDMGSLLAGLGMHATDKLAA